MIYLASYKGRVKVRGIATLKDWLIDYTIRKFTKGKYSHCELVISRDDGLYDCYSSSPRDGGVRYKQMPLSSDNWDFIQLDGNIDGITEKRITDYYEKTKGTKYDLLGALGVILPIHEDRNKAFCSEWCFNCLYDSDQGWRFSPNQLGVIVSGKAVL